MRKSLLRVLPWVVTVGLLAIVFSRISFHDVVADTRRAAPWMVPVTLACVAAVYLADSFAIWKTFGWFLTRMSFTDVLLVRGATYLLAAINYNVGQGAIVYFVHRNAGTTIMRGVATILLVLGTNVLALLFLATAGMTVAPAVPFAVKVLVAVAWGGLAIYVVAVALRPRWLDKPLFEVLLNAGVGGHLRALAVRVPHIASLVILQFTLLHAFGIQVPLVDALATLPVIFLVAVLPISIQGLGTTQAAMVYFFAQYAPGDPKMREAAVVAASIVGQALASAFQAALGVVCLRSRVGRALRASTKAAAEIAPAEPGRPATPAQAP
jgi:Lysylphosphatidylglycerol synthase TM region